MGADIFGEADRSTRCENNIKRLNTLNLVGKGRVKLINCYGLVA